MTIKEYIESLIRRRVICDLYARRISLAETKLDYFRILCDSNGSYFIADLQDKGIPIPIDELKKEFHQYLNGKKIMKYESGVSSKMYVDFSDEVVADTTIVSCINCSCNISVPKNMFPRIVLDQKSDVNIVMGQDSRLTLDIYKGAKYNIIGDQTKVRVTILPIKEDEY